MCVSSLIPNLAHKKASISFTGQLSLSSGQQSRIHLSAPCAGVSRDGEIKKGRTDCRCPEGKKKAQSGFV